MLPGAVNVAMAEPTPLVAVPMVGAPGMTEGVAGGEAAEAGPVPIGLVALTVKVYAVPLFNPLMVHDTVPVVVQVWPPLEVTEYPVMASPPFDAGAFQETTDWLFAYDVPVTPVGAPGLVGTTTGLDGTEDDPTPSPLVADTVKV